jgi:hypothetical protein
MSQPFYGPEWDRMVAANRASFETSRRRTARQLEERRRQAVEVADLFAVPPHLVIENYPEHRWTWRARRRWRMASRRWQRRNLSPHTSRNHP